MRITTIITYINLTLSFVLLGMVLYLYIPDFTPTPTTIPFKIRMINLTEQQQQEVYRLTDRIKPEYNHAINQITFQTTPIPNIYDAELENCGVYQGITKHITINIDRYHNNKVCPPLDELLCHEILHGILRFPIESVEEEHQLIRKLEHKGVCYT